eukprot:1560122-Heterocapsa_arctica.AAC.1
MTSGGSVSSLGMAERFAPDLRTLCVEFEDRWRTMVKASSAVLSWMVRHAVYVYNRFLRWEDGRTPFEVAYERTFKQSLYVFGTSVLVRVPQATTLPKLEA